MNIYDFFGVKEGEKPLDRIVADGGFCSIFRTIACIGDSLASGEFEAKKPDGTMQYIDMYEYSWGQFIGRSCGSTVYNFSRGGMSAKEYMESFSINENLWSLDKLAQAYIIAFGVNDLFYHQQPVGSINDIDLNDDTNNAETFAGYYGRIIQQIKKIQPRAKIFLVTIPKGGTERDKIQQEHRDLLYEFTKLFKNVYLIDLFTYSPLQDKEFFDLFWHGHLSPTGYVLTARMIESYIDYIIRQNPAEFKEVGFIGTDLYYSEEKV